MDRDSDLWKKYAHVTDEVLIDEPFQERDLSTVKSAWLLESWIDEKTLRQIESVHDVAPGDLHHRTDRHHMTDLEKVGLAPQEIHRLRQAVQKLAAIGKASRMYCLRTFVN